MPDEAVLCIIDDIKYICFVNISFFPITCTSYVLRLLTLHTYTHTHTPISHLVKFIWGIKGKKTFLFINFEK